MSPSPEIAVVVPSHDRPLRLRWLLNALEEQTLPRERWEVVVGHDSAGPETEQLLHEHPLAAAGVLRHVTLPPGSAPPGANRNAAWRVARAPVIAFTDDDCRPPADWLERALVAAGDNPGAIVQGATTKDPEEQHIASAPFNHSRSVVPPTPWAEACNIVYPREVLEQLGGFDESMYTGEDCELALRARAQGVRYVGDRRMLTHHAVIEMSFLDALRGTWRWGDLAELARRHPEIRDDYPLGIFWKRAHLWLPFALAAAVLERRNPLWALLAVPYLANAVPRHGNDPRGRIREMVETPGRMVIDAVEFAALVRGSIRHRSLLL